ncbi:hypothetical protein WA158_007079 [Blastocystis sp. Blastoise]
MKQIFILLAFLIAFALSEPTLTINESVTSTTSSIEAKATLSEEGFIWALAQLTSASVPSVETMKSSGVKVNATATTEMTISISSLESNTTYAVYYYATNLEDAASSLSIEDSKHTIATKAAATGLTIDIINVTPYKKYIAVSISTNKVGTAYCVALTENSEIPTSEALLASNSTGELKLSEAISIHINDLKDSTTYDVYCYAIDSDGVPMTNTIENTKHTSTTPGLPDVTLTVESVTPSSTSVAIKVISTEDGKVWCYASTTSTEPTAITIKQGQTGTSILKNTTSTITLSLLTASTEYHSWCYAEDNEQDPMTNTIASTMKTFTTSEPPPEGPTLSFTTEEPTKTSVTCAVTLSTNGIVWCRNTAVSATTPDTMYIRQSLYHSEVTANNVTSITIEGLEEGNEYDIYCYGENTDNVPMKTTLESIKKTITTSGGIDVTLVIGDPTVNGQIVTVPMTLNVVGSIWCGIFDTTASTPTAALIKEQNHVISIEASTLKDLIIEDVAVGTHDMYCYGQNQQGKAMTNTIESTKHIIDIAKPKCTKDCIFGVCDDESKLCSCFNGFEVDSKGLCTVEKNVYRFLLKFTTTVDISTPEKKREFSNQVIKDIATSVTVAPSHFTSVFIIASPLTISIDINPSSTGILSGYDIVLRLKELVENPSSSLYSGIYTSKLDQSYGIKWQSVYHCNSDVIITPNTIVETVTSLEDTPVSGSIKVSASTSDHDMYLYTVQKFGDNYDWFELDTMPVQVPYSGVSVNYKLNPAKAQIGVNVVSIVIHSLYGDSSMATFVLVVGEISTNTNVCEDLSGLSGMDYIIGLFTKTYSFIPGLIIGVVAMFILVLIKVNATSKPSASSASGEDSEDNKYNHELSLTSPDSLDQFTYQQKWSGASETQTFTLKIRGVPKEGKLEEMLKKSDIYCSSSSTIDKTIKYHFYGQDGESSDYVLADMIIERVSKTLNVIVKANHDNFCSDFYNLLNNKLARLAATN